MLTGLTVAACLLLGGTSLQATDFTPMSTRKFEIPLPVDPSQRADIKELHVYVSKDLGKNWDKIVVAIPVHERENPKVVYEARDDGMYWFTVSTVYKSSGQEDPPHAWEGPVGQKILVDTHPPIIKLKSERLGDKVRADWAIDETYPVRTSFRLEFEDPVSQKWFPIPEAQAGPKGSVTFSPPTQGAVKVRLTLKDVAENLGKDEVLVPAGTTAVVQNPPASPNWPENQTLPDNTGLPAPITPVGVQQPPLPTVTESHSPLTGGPASSGIATGTPTMPTTTPTMMNASLPPVKLVKDNPVKIEFGVDHLGVSGLGNVEVYLTVDDGMHWEKMASGTTSVTQADPGAQGPRGAVMINLPQQAVVYGIYLVIKNGAGVGGPAPRNDGKNRPMMRIEVDSTAPEIYLLTPEADRDHEGVLILKWQATDRNLEDYPVSIEYSAEREGPWQYVSPTPNLPNTRSYAWHVPNIPQGKVYLRMTARDKAENVTQATTSKPVLVDLNHPIPVNLTIVGGGS